MLIDMGPLLAEELGQSAVVKLLIFFRINGLDPNLLPPNLNY